MKKTVCIVISLLSIGLLLAGCQGNGTSPTASLPVKGVSPSANGSSDTGAPMIDWDKLDTISIVDSNEKLVEITATLEIAGDQETLNKYICIFDDGTDPYIAYPKNKQIGEGTASIDIAKINDDGSLTSVAEISVEPGQFIQTMGGNDQYLVYHLTAEDTQAAKDAKTKSQTILIDRATNKRTTLFEQEGRHRNWQLVFSQNYLLFDIYFNDGYTGAQGNIYELKTQKTQEFEWVYNVTQGYYLTQDDYLITNNVTSIEILELATDKTSSFPLNYKNQKGNIMEFGFGNLEYDGQYIFLESYDPTTNHSDFFLFNRADGIGIPFYQSAIVNNQLENISSNLHLRNGEVRWTEYDKAAGTYTLLVYDHTIQAITRYRLTSGELNHSGLFVTDWTHDTMGKITVSITRVS